MTEMSLRRSSSRRPRRKKPPFERFKDHFRHFIAFMFSNVGIIILVIFYTIGGAFIFQAIEIFESEKSYAMISREFLARNFTRECLERLWSLTSQHISFYNHRQFKQRVDEILLDYQRNLVTRELLGRDVEKQWSFSGAFLYSLTVITTIGYGNISPKSDWGKIVTILYAIIGMPLFLLYLSNIGDVMAKSFKWIYSKLCLCRICPGVAKRRLLRERQKMRELAMNKALYEMKTTQNKQRLKQQQQEQQILNRKNDHSDSGRRVSRQNYGHDQQHRSYRNTSMHNQNRNSHPKQKRIRRQSQSHSRSRSHGRNAPNYVKNYSSQSSSTDESTSSTTSYTSSNSVDCTEETASTAHEATVLDMHEDQFESDIEREIMRNTDEITVPLTVCVLIMISYILSGAILFGRWEDWGYLDGSYFCFISLSSIGFGDLVPGDRVITADKDKVELSFILCAVYLLLGMALIAMCFNLMQEQVIHNVRATKRAFKACFRCR